MLTEAEKDQIFAEAGAVITDDHFVYAKKSDGWYHGSAYVNKDAIYPHTKQVRQLCKDIAKHFKNEQVEVVVGPTLGAVVLAQWTAHFLTLSIEALSPGREVLAVCADEGEVLEQISLSRGEIREFQSALEFSFNALGLVQVKLDPAGRIGSISYMEKSGTKRVVKRGYNKVVAGKRCLIVEDIINSGITVEKTCKAVAECKGDVVGVACLCNRSGGKVTAETLGVIDLFSLKDVSMEMFPEDNCPICKEKGPKSVRTDLGKGLEFLQRKGLD